MPPLIRALALLPILIGLTSVLEDLINAHERAHWVRAGKPRVWP